MFEEKLIEPGSILLSKISQTQKRQVSFFVLSVESRFTYIHVCDENRKHIYGIKGKWELIEGEKTSSRMEDKAGQNSGHEYELNVIIHMH